MKRCFCRW
jgi:hypothetical protein